MEGWDPTWSIVPHYWNDTHTHKLDDDDGDGGVRWRILLRVVFLFVVVLDGPRRRTDHVPRVRQTEPTIFEQIFSFQKKPKDINFTSTHHRLRRRFGVYWNQLTNGPTNHLRESSNSSSKYRKEENGCVFIFRRPLTLSLSWLHVGTV